LRSLSAWRASCLDLATAAAPPFTSSTEAPIARCRAALQAALLHVLSGLVCFSSGSCSA
jgi:hypothetical protein